jgi:hypothetical protein
LPPPQRRALDAAFGLVGDRRERRSARHVRIEAGQLVATPAARVVVCVSATNAAPTSTRLSFISLAA